jgi:hypothetical protein
MLPLKHLAGLGFFISTICSAVTNTGRNFQSLESRQLESNGLPSVDNFLSRAYHSGTENQPLLFRNADPCSYRARQLSLH